ncbi:unnamed protein product [Parajaminaea phylloscopi]
MEALEQFLNTLPQQQEAMSDTIPVSIIDSASTSKKELLPRHDLWSPYLGLHLSILLVALFFYEVFRYFSLQRSYERQGVVYDRPCVKGTLVALAAVVLTQTVFAGWAGYALFVKHWGDDEQAAREMLYGNMISDALIATLTHALYSWHLFGLIPPRRQWMGWMNTLCVMVLSAAQLACCIMAALGYAQAQPVLMTAHDVHLVRTMFRTWLSLCAAADLLISVGWFSRGYWSIQTSLFGTSRSPWDKPCLLVRLLRTFARILLPGNLLAALVTLLALLLETTAEERDHFSWLLICSSKVHGLAIVLCLNSRSGADVRHDCASTPTTKPALRPLLIGRQEAIPPSILIKKHDDEPVREDFKAASPAPPLCGLRGAGDAGATDDAGNPRTAFEDHRLRDYTAVRRHRAGSHRSDRTQGANTVYSSGYALPFYVQTTGSSPSRRHREDSHGSAHPDDRQSPVPSSADSDVTLTGLNGGTAADTPCGSLYEEDMAKDGIAKGSVPVTLAYSCPAGSPPARPADAGAVLYSLPHDMGPLMSSEPLYPPTRTPYTWVRSQGAAPAPHSSYVWSEYGPVAEEGANLYGPHRGPFTRPRLYRSAASSGPRG